MPTKPIPKPTTAEIEQSLNDTVERIKRMLAALPKVEIGHKGK